MTNNRPRKHAAKPPHASPAVVLSPRGNESHFAPRRTHQRTPRRLCTLALPPPDDLGEAAPPSRHRRHPSDHTAGLSVDPTEYSHCTVATRGGSMEGLPRHCRVGMACPPLLLAGQFVVAAAVDGRVALYRVEDYGGGGEDVLGSERRRRAEWREEEEGEEKKPWLEDSLGGVEEEEVMMERMTRRERGRECVDPLVVVSLPVGGSGGPVPTGGMSRMMADMCATPFGVGRMPPRGPQESKDDDQMLELERLIGYVAVLMDNGEVHVLEVLSGQSMTVTDSPGTSDDAIIHDFVPVVNVILSFQTGYLGATCICMQPIFETTAPSPNTKSDYDAGTESEANVPNSCNKRASNLRDLRFCIGHECGILECYQLYDALCTSETATIKSQCSSNNIAGLSSPYSLIKSKSNETPRNNNNTPKRNSSFLSARLALNAQEETVNDSFDSTCVNDSPMLSRTLSEPTDPLTASAQKPPFTGSEGRMLHPIDVKMCWKGRMTVPIRSIACPVASVAGSKSPSLLVIGLVQRQQESSLCDADPRTGLKSKYQELSPALSLEVIDVALVQEYWFRMKAEVSCEQDSMNLCVTLNDCSVWPAAGMEIKDGWTRSDVPTRESVCRALGLRSSSITNKICCFVDDYPCFASATSDGTVAISHVNQDGSWGVRHEFNQVMLHQRCIGMGPIEYASTSNDRRRYICCCLRGGTMYLVPVIDNAKDALNCSSKASAEISMFVIPVDPSGEDDGVVRYVQNFTSGMAYVPRWKDASRDIDHKTLPNRPEDPSLMSIALVGWNGGTIDVYEVHPGGTVHNGELFRKLVERGLARKLVETLLIVNASHPLLSSVSWHEAWNECNRVKDIDAILTGIKDVSRMDFVSTRELILSVIGS